LGKIPEGWKVVFLSDIANFISGYSYKGNELVPSKQAMATIKNFQRKGGFKLDGFKEIIPSDKIKKEQYANIYDILVAHTDLTQNADVIGNAEMLLSNGDYEKIIFSMDLVKVEPKEVFPYRFFIASLLQSEKFKSYCLGYVNGTTVLHLSKKALPNYILAIPHNNAYIVQFDNLLSNLYKKMSELIKENSKLSLLRDSLLPRLMSGEIEV
jgi:type I restriction enzyme S subunit